MSTTDLKALDESDKQLKVLVERGEALERLKSNRDFKKLILKDYFEQEAIRLVHLKADINQQDEKSQKFIVNQMDAIGNLHSYLQTVEFMAKRARVGLADNEETRAEILEDEGEVNV